MTEYQILIVEDDVELGRAFADILDSQGMNTELVMDGRSALTRLNEYQPDFVLLDLHLPHVSGLELLEEIRADQRLKKTIVVVVTADALRAEEAQEKADLVLLKPVSLDQLLNLTQRFVA